MKTKKDQKKTRNRYKIKNSNKGLLPRIVLNKSNKNIYAQLICSISGKVIAQYSSLSKSFNDITKNEKCSGVEKAKKVAQEFAKICIQLGIKKAVFDRGEYSYKGERVRSFAGYCRQGGIVF